MLAIEENVSLHEIEGNKLISRILVPVDFSIRSADAASSAIELAARFQAQVTLLHVAKPLEGDAFWSAQAARWAQEQLAGFVPEARQSPNVQRIVSLHPEISDEILRVAAETRADLIFMQAHDYGVIRRTLLGSVTAKVLEGAACPVWSNAHCQPASPDRWIEADRIVCAVDSVPEGSRVLSWASALASELNARLCVAWSRRGLSETPEEISRLERSHRIYAEEVIEAGNIPSALRRAVTRMQANLLVIGKDFWKPPAGPGLDLHQVLRKAPCPVISM